MPEMVYIDIAFFVIIALWMVLGLIRGIAKSTKGFFWAVTVVLCALLILGATFDMVRPTAAFETIDNKISQGAADWGAAFNTPIKVDTSGEEPFYYIEAGDSQIALESFDGIKGKFANFLAQRFITEENSGSSLASVASGMLTSVIAAVILFVGYSIGLGLVGFILRKITKGMHKHENKAVNALDRIFGALIGGALAIVFILVVLAILKSVNVDTVNEFINQSTICSYFFNANPISSVFSKIFGA